MPETNSPCRFLRSFLSLLLILTFSPISLVAAHPSWVLPHTNHVSILTGLSAQPPRLLTQSNSTRALALDTTTLLSEPFSLTQSISFSSDARTRLLLLATDIDPATTTGNSYALSADAEDETHRIFPLIVEYAYRLPEPDSVCAIYVRLNDDMSANGDVLIRLYDNGLASNRVRVGLGHVGGGPPDDPTPQPSPSSGSAPAITGLLPSSVTAGAGGVMLSINGSNFTGSSTVRFDGNQLSATYVSDSLMLAPLSNSDVANAGTHTVTVQSPGPITSNPSILTVNNPQPAISSLSPSSAIKGGAGFTLNVIGNGFVQGSTVKFNGSNRVTTFVSATLLTVQILAADLGFAGSFPLNVTNPSPGGGSSSDASFNVSQPAPTPSPSSSPTPNPTPTPSASPTPTPTPNPTPAPTPFPSPILGATEINLAKVLLGRQNYSGQHIMWKDPSNHINIINSFGGGETGPETTYIHYINTFTGAHALVEGGKCSFGRNSTYDPARNKFYYYGEYCSHSTGGTVSEFDPVTMTNRVIATGGTAWWSGTAIALGADGKVYFTAIQGDQTNDPAHLYQYDPAVGPSSWTDLGVIYGPSNGISPQLFADTAYVYVSWQDNTNGYYHLMTRPTANGSWSEVNFGDGLNVIAPYYHLNIQVDKITKKLFLSRTPTSGVTSYYWLTGGAATLITGNPPSANTGALGELDVKHHISMMDYGNRSLFIAAYDYDMNWDASIPNSGNMVSTVFYGPHSTWNYPTSNFATSSLTYSGALYDLPINSIVPYSSSSFYAFGLTGGSSNYNYLNQTSGQVGALPAVSVYYAFRVPAANSPLGVDEVYYAGYPNQRFRWNPSAPISSTNPVAVPHSTGMEDYPLFMDYDSAGKIWIGGNACGATPGCIDYGSVAWYDPVAKTAGEMFSGTWTGGNPPATGTGIQYRNFAMSNNRGKLVVSSNDGKLTVINALTKTIEGTYSLGASAWMVEVANDQVLGVTGSTTTTNAQVFLFRPSNRTMIVAPQSTGVTGYMFGTADGHSSRRDFKLELGPDGYAWIFVDKKVYRINPSTLAFQFVATDSGGHNKLIWSYNKKDLIVYGGTNAGYFRIY